jgi:hypothetical protein
MPPLNPENDVTAYIVVEDFGDLGRAFLETDLAEADHDTIVRNMISGEYTDPLRVVAFNTVRCGARFHSPGPHGDQHDLAISVYFDPRHRHAGGDDSLHSLGDVTLPEGALAAGHGFEATRSRMGIGDLSASLAPFTSTTKRSPLLRKASFATSPTPSSTTPCPGARPIEPSGRMNLVFPLGKSMVSAWTA